MACRVALGRVLAVVPLSWIGPLRESYPTATGLRRRVLATALGILRHRPLSPLSEFTLPAGPATEQSPVRLAAVESRLVRLLYWYGPAGYERDETAWWGRFCSHSRHVLELGANIGYYTVLGALAAPRTRYVAVEAHPDSVAVLRRNTELNALENVEVVHAAVLGDAATATAELALPDQERYRAPTGAFLRTGTEGVGTRRPAGTTITVPTVAVSDLITGVDLVKLDIEGLEHEVLAAAFDTVVANRVTVLVEVLRDTPRLRELLGELRNANYLLLAVGARALSVLPASELATVDLTARYGGRDVIVLPGEKSWMLDDPAVGRADTEPH